MFAHQRRNKILELLIEDGTAKVTDLSKIFKVSEVTIRQDLDKLEREDLIIREHGGAFLKSLPSQVQSFTFQHMENMDKKARIGKKASELIKNGDMIIIDSGSTTTEIAKNIKDRKDLTVVTNAVNVPFIIGGQPGITVLLTSGEFKAPTLSLTGQKAADFFVNVHVDKLFLATAGVTLRAGLTYPSINDLPVKRAMIEAASTVYLVADSTKLGKQSLASLGALSLMDYLITDSEIGEEYKQEFSKHGIEFIIA
ncbi:DeoR/GlpR transcriptional regulator [candidate division KSB1 bacterium]|nr:DeoR/GlpR transcriptional regulator [candidate division KSB1 bacterium]